MVSNWILVNNRLLLQFGIENGYTGITVTLPISYSSSNYHVYLQSWGANGGANPTVVTASRRLSQFSESVTRADGSQTFSGFWWLTIGW